GADGPESSLLGARATVSPASSTRSERHGSPDAARRDPDRGSGAPLARLFAGALAVLLKDLRIELATREIVTTAAFFAALVAILASVAFTTGPQVTARVAPGALWLAVVFSSVLALGRSWQREREESALVGLLVSPVPRAAIWLGKAAGVFAFILAVEGVVVALVAVLFHRGMIDVGVPLVLVIFCGDVTYVWLCRI